MNTEFESDFDLLSQARPSLTVESYRMRCPSCKKLYSVEPHRLGREDFSKFECVDCQTCFFAVRPDFQGSLVLETRELETQFAPLISALAPSLPDIEDSFDGLVEGPQGTTRGVLQSLVRSSVLQVPTQTRECPNCHTPNALSNVECTKCEVVIAQFRPGADIADDAGLSESSELALMWREIQDDYQDIARHESFVARCASEQRLIFAAHKYAQILVAAPEESIARLMRARVQGLAAYGFDARDRGLGWATWSFPLPSFNSFMILLGTILVVVGLGFPNMAHTAGLGFAMIALAISLRVFLRRPRL